MISAAIQQGTPAPSVFLEVFAGVVVLMLGGIFAFVTKKFNLLDKFYGAMVTREPSELEPDPPKGFIDQLRDNTKETKENSEAVLAMSARFGQQNGTVLEIQTDVANLHALVSEIATAGANVKLELDAEASKVATIAHESQTELLDAIHSHEGHTP